MKNSAIVCCSILIVIAVAMPACRRRTPSKKPIAEQPISRVTAVPPEAAPSRAPTLPEKKTVAHEVNVAWYDVPIGSLAARRAGDEFTAAHDRLRIGTRVRLTNPANERSVIVRITDRGVPRRAPQLDISKPAAEELGTLHEGVAKLWMEVLPDDDKTGGFRDSEAAARR